MLLLQAPCSGYKPTLEALLLHGILRHAELVVAEANLVFGWGHVVVLLWVSVRRLFFWADLLIFLFGLLEAVANRYPDLDLGIVTVPSMFMNALPYILTVIILAGFIGRATPPRAGGEPYVKER